MIIIIGINKNDLYLFCLRSQSALEHRRVLRPVPLRMTEGEKRCGLGSFLPMSCRGRAESFARRLHNRLRTLGSQDDGVDPHTSENSWLASNEISNSIVTNCQPRHSGTENDLLMDLGIFDSPGSPAEELPEHEITKFITNPKDDLHHLNLDECGCLASTNCQIIKRNSLDSDSSDGQYFDPENGDVDVQRNGINHVSNNVSSSETNGVDSISNQLTEKEPSENECTLSSLSQNLSEEEQFNDSFTEINLDKEEIQNTETEWTLSFDPNKVINSNNNVYSAIDLESLKSCINPVEERSTSKSTDANELYSSHFEIHQDLTIECPCTNICTPTPEVQVSTLEIQDTDECAEETKSTTKDEICACNNEQAINSNHLKVEEIDDTELEDRTPRVRRCSSLKTGKTPPGTPGRKKIVRFADVLGLDLADVRTFLDEIPKVPISAFDDLSVTDLSLSDTSLTSTPNSGSASTKTLVPLFQQPGGEADFMDKVRSNHVCLENAVVNDSIALCVCGTVRVLNLDFNKSVHIRYSLDQWKSFSDLQATYVDNSCDGFSDKFSFTLYVHTLTVGQRLEFAVRFQCKGCQYWDNNAGANYCFQCMPPCANSSYAPITAPDDTTWAGAAFY